MFNSKNQTEVDCELKEKLVAKASGRKVLTKYVVESDEEADSQEDLAIDDEALVQELGLRDDFSLEDIASIEEKLDEIKEKEDVAISISEVDEGSLCDMQIDVGDLEEALPSSSFDCQDISSSLLNEIEGDKLKVNNPKGVSQDSTLIHSKPSPQQI